MNRRLSYAEWGELVRRAQTGEEKAFEELYYASYDYLYTVCFKSGVPEEEIGDVLQDTYLKIFKNLGSINDPERFLPWAAMIAKNMGRDRGRQRKNYYEHNDLMGDTSTEEEQGIDTLATDEMDPCYSPEAALDRAATSKIVSEMIAELPEGQRDCIILWCNGWSTSDIASELRIPEGTAKTRIFQAKKKIEKKTLEVEKRQGIRLHTVAPISFFIWSIRNIHRILDIAPADFSGIRSELMASGQIAAHGTSMAQGTSMSGGYYGQGRIYRTNAVAKGKETRFWATAGGKAAAVCLAAAIGAGSLLLVSRAVRQTQQSAAASTAQQTQQSAAASTTQQSQQTQQVALQNTSDTCLGGQAEIELVDWNLDKSTITVRIYNHANMEIRTFGLPIQVIDGRSVELDPYSNMTVSAVGIATESYADIEYYVDPSIFVKGGRIDGKLHIMDPAINDLDYSLDVIII